MAIQTKRQERQPILRHFPILTWLPKYQRVWLRGDIIAGATVLALLIPEGMAYAEIAGLPPQTVFYAAPIALLLYAIFGTSRQLVVAVSAAIATMSAAAVAPLAQAGTPEYAAFSAGLAIMAGLISVLAGLFKLGRIASFFSESVLTGFITGLALTISIKQVPKLFGFEGGEGNFWQRLYDILIHLDQTHLLTLVVGLVSIALLLFLEHRFHKLPASLIVMVLGIVVSSIFSLAALGVHVVGDIPAGLAPPKIPELSMDQWLLLVPAALGLALVNFAEGNGPARDFATKHEYEIDADQELVGLGAANLGAGLFQGFPVGSSLSKSAANDRAGAKTPVALIVCAVLTVLVGLYFTPLFASLPEAVLAAVVVVAISGMIKVKEIRRLYRLNRVDFSLAIVALLGVLTFEALQGLLIAVIVSLLALIWRASQSRLTVLGRESGSVVFSDVRRHPENRTIPGFLIVRPDEGLLFANAEGLRKRIMAVLDETKPATKVLLLNLEMSNQVDVPSMDMLVELKKETELRGAELWLTRLHKSVHDALEQSGVLHEIGLENVRPRILGSTIDYLLHLTPDGLKDMPDVEEELDLLLEVGNLLLAQTTGERRQELEEARQALAELKLMLKG